MTDPFSDLTCRDQECRVPISEESIDFIDEGKHVIVESTHDHNSSKLIRPMTTVIGRRK
jgi:hypothetical protein